MTGARAGELRKAATTLAEGREGVLMLGASMLHIFLSNHFTKKLVMTRILGGGKLALMAYVGGILKVQ